MLDIGEPARGGFVAFLAAGGFGARFADRFERRARGLIGFGKLGLGFGQTVGGGAALAVAVSISPIKACRWAANFCGALISSARSCVASSVRCPSVAICAAALSLRSFHALRSSAMAASR